MIKKIKEKISLKKIIIIFLCFFFPFFVFFNNNKNSLIEQKNNKNHFFSKEKEKEKSDFSIEIIGNINKSSNYAVFSTTSNSRSSLTFIFYLPLTTLAWKRVGFSSVIIIIGEFQNWKKDPLFNLVLEKLEKLKVVLVFIKVDEIYSVMISQISRVFIVNILTNHFGDLGDLYLVTSDSDLWPFHRNSYLLIPGKKILSLNSECCGFFKRSGKNVKMVPMANVGMSAKTWIELFKEFGNFSDLGKIENILEFVFKEFGIQANKPVVKGENKLWYLDQTILSVLINNYQKNHPSSIKYVSRSVQFDRVDRSGWGPDFSVEDKIDAHLLIDPFLDKNWNRLKPLIKNLFSFGIFSELHEYYLLFRDSFSLKN